MSGAKHGPRRLSQKVCRTGVKSDHLREREGNIFDICSIYITGSTQYCQQAQYISRTEVCQPPLPPIPHLVVGGERSAPPPRSQSQAQWTTRGPSRHPQEPAHSVTTAAPSTRALLGCRRGSGLCLAASLDAINRFHTSYWAAGGLQTGPRRGGGGGPKMVRPDFPNGKFRVPPRRSLWSGLLRWLSAVPIQS